MNKDYLKLLESPTFIDWNQALELMREYLIFFEFNLEFYEYLSKHPSLPREIYINNKTGDFQLSPSIECYDSEKNYISCLSLILEEIAKENPLEVKREKKNTYKSSCGVSSMTSVHWIECALYNPEVKRYLRIEEFNYFLKTGKVL